MDATDFDPNAASFDPKLYADGGVSLTEIELEALGDVTGFDVLVAPEGTIEEALSLANLGANVTVLGLANASARSAVEESGVGLRLETGGLGEGVVPLEPASFDIVYSPWGSLDGLASFENWAHDVASLLRPGGHLIASDEHPVSFTVAARDGALVVERAYWGEFVDDDGDREPSEFESTWGWALGDLITQLGTAGLATIRLEELPEAPSRLTALDLIEGVTDEQRSLLPTALLLVARKL